VNTDRDQKRKSLFARYPHLRYSWLILLPLGFLWFPFDWLAQVWPVFGVPFRQVFHDAHDHFVGHSVFFFLIGTIILILVPALIRRPLWYLVGLILAALIQETIQAFFRGEIPTFTDFNAFKGDALGGTGAWLFCFLLLWLSTSFKQRKQQQPAPQKEGS